MPPVPRTDHGRPAAPAWWAAVLLGSMVVAVTVLGSHASGSFTAAISNAADRVQTSSLLTAATVGGVSECDLSGAIYSPITSVNTAACTGSLLSAGNAPATATSAVSTLVTDKGSVPAAAAQLTKSTCGAVQLANSAAASDPMLVRGNTLTFSQPGPLTSSLGIGMSGGASGTGYAAEVTPGAASNSFTEVIWFKATTNGTLMGFTNTPAVNSVTNWDRMLWVDSTGHVVFGVRPSAIVELTSPAATYLDGKWHLAAGSVSAAGMVLTVDGVTVATNAATKTGQAYTGYWHVGWDNENSSYSNPPTTPYFAGTLANAAVFPVLSAAQLSALYTAGTQTVWNTDLVSDGATKAWTLGDAGSTAYTGTVPSVTPNACAFIDLTVGATGTATSCMAPASVVACAAPTSALTLASLAATTTVSVLPTTTQTLTLTLTLARDATTTIAANPYAAGLHLTAPMSLVTANGAFSATLSWPSENVVL